MIVNYVGFVGLFNLLLLWPLFFVIHYMGMETFEWPTHRQWVFLIINGIVGTVFSEVLWLWLVNNNQHNLFSE
jgi:solute carrier family 35 protein F5